MGQMLSKDSTWLQDRVASFQPTKNKLMTSNGNEVFDYLLSLVLIFLLKHFILSGHQLFLILNVLL